MKVFKGIFSFQMSLCHGHPLHSHCCSLTYLRHLLRRTWSKQVVGCPSVFACSHSKEGILEALGGYSGFCWVWDFVVVFKLFALMPYDKECASLYFCKILYIYPEWRHFVVVCVSEIGYRYALCLSFSTRPAVWSTQSPIQWIAGV